MKMPPRSDLRGADGSLSAGAALISADRQVPLACLAQANPFSQPLAGLRGARCLLRTKSQLAAALAMIALDGVAARLVIAPPDLAGDDIADLVSRAGIDTLVSDGGPLHGLRHVPLSCGAPLSLSASSDGETACGTACETEWLLFTSGTTGAPKMAVHTLGSLTGAIAPPAGRGPVVWGTFYDIRRYGGLQILLRALLGRASLILSDADEPVGAFLNRLAEHKVTHLTGTPSHWRRGLMSPAIGAIAPAYVRLSGETADQALLDRLKARFPDAAVGHAYASTEAGVGFEVTDGREGFPASLLGGKGIVAMKIEDGSLRIRSPRRARTILGGAELAAPDGYIDTGDLIERRADRCYFAGRRGGIINVGGLKINPEEVEAVLNRMPGVAQARVSGRSNPITGALVVADVVLADPANDNAHFRDLLLALARENLPAFKVPAMLRFVPGLALSPGGKLVRGRG